MEVGTLTGGGALNAPSVWKNLSEVLTIPQNRFQSTEGYIRLLKLLHSTAWFQSNRPKDPDELKIWHYRVAMLDAIFYE